MINSTFMGYLRIVGIAGKVSSVLDKIPIWGKLNFDKIALKESSQGAKVDYDRKLEIQILPPTSALKVTFSKVPREVLAGEIFPITIEIVNSGPNPIDDLYIATNSPKELIIDSHTSLPLSVEKGQ